jgi:hypothetical protein
MRGSVADRERAEGWIELFRVFHAVPSPTNRVPDGDGSSFTAKASLPDGAFGINPKSL